MSARVLIIDDDANICMMLSATTERLGHQAICVSSLEEAATKLNMESFDLVFLDVWLPDGNGLDRLKEIQHAPSCPEVIIITGAGDPDGAELAIMSGAWDYLEKPFTVDVIAFRLTRAIQFREQKKARTNSRANRESLSTLKREQIVGNSPGMTACLDLLAQSAQSDASVLITGETGTGKEQFALAVHENSSRADKAFVVVDCAALSETLVESILFGHEKGAFTGADRAQTGMLKQADKGTLVLDEIGELPLSVQKSFLRVLQERRFRPIGGSREVESDFRLVAVTNRDLHQSVSEGLFRSDLLFRIRSFVIHLPPLRDRSEDIRDLAFHYTAKLCQRYEMSEKKLSAELLSTFMAYDWPGNVREMVQALERALMAARSEQILYPDHLPIHIRAKVARASVASRPSISFGSTASFKFSGNIPPLCDFRQTVVAEAEKSYLQHLLCLRDVNLSEICSISGLSRSHFYALLRKHGIKR